MNKKGNAVLIGVIAVIVVVALAVMGMYNSLVSADTTTEAKWGNVQSSFQRRADLIPNIVDTVKAYKNYEQETLVKITELRSQAGQLQQDISETKTPQQLQDVSQEMSSVLSRLLVIVEAYPDLKASENFLALQDELAGTENRINYERTEYNNAVKTYKQRIRSFPTNILAGMFGFSIDKWNMFEADAGAEKAPKVNLI